MKKNVVKSKFTFCLGNQEATFDVHHHSSALDDGGGEEEYTVHQPYCIMEGGEGPGCSGGVDNRELTHNEQVITMFSSIWGFFVFVTVNRTFGETFSNT